MMQHLRTSNKRQQLEEQTRTDDDFIDDETPADPQQAASDDHWRKTSQMVRHSYLFYIFIQILNTFNS
jgi:hypothetical protein